MREVVALLRSEERKRSISVTLEAGASAAVLGDRSHIEQVAVNLIRNAYESFESESRDRRVTIRVTANETEAAVSVQDNGAGIGPDAPRLAEAFHSTKPHGLGLGLGICRTVLERHHGRLRIEAGPDGGTVARFTLPRHSSRGEDA
jgi:C4-dicarboxylate-specific signal transduction histidine kinase